MKQVSPHLPALDGIRGAALLGVLFFHAQGVLAGGYLGVDLFFVLSGYLITSLLLSEHRSSGRIDLAAFWVRRARRLFPALLSLMPAIAIYCWCIAKPDELANLRAEALATLAYVANWRAVFAHKSYWELFASPSPLEHTWSLAIEEQFYVVWPLVCAFVLSRWKARGIRWLAIAFGIASMVEMAILGNAESTSRAYMGTDTRATAILAGAALATFVSPMTTFDGRTVRVLDAIGVFALAALATAWWKLDGMSPLALSRRLLVDAGVRALAHLVRHRGTRELRRARALDRAAALRRYDQLRPVFAGTGPCSSCSRAIDFTRTDGSSSRFKSR